MTFNLALFNLMPLPLTLPFSLFFRLWYLQDTFPSPVRSQNSTVIVSRTYIPRDGERYDQLLNRVNTALTKDKIGGEERQSGEAGRGGEKYEEYGGVAEGKLSCWMRHQFSKSFILDFITECNIVILS